MRLESRVRELRNAGDEGEREERNRELEKNNNQTEQQKSQPEARRAVGIEPRTEWAAAGSG